MYTEVTPGDELDLLVETNPSVISATPVQHRNDDPCFTERFLRIALNHDSVIASLKMHRWSFRWDNAGKVDTVLRDLGYTATWINEFNWSGCYWVELADIKFKEDI